VTRALDEVLQKKIVCALLAVTQLELLAVQLHAGFLADLDLRLRAAFLAFDVCVQDLPLKKASTTKDTKGHQGKAKPKL
jgi:hypothetical protein